MWKLAEYVGDSYPGSEPQAQTLNEQSHDELGSQPIESSKDYNFLFAQGQFHASPDLDYEQLADNAGIPLDYQGPVALGHIHVYMGKADFEVQSNSGAIASILEGFAQQNGLHIGSITDLDGNPLKDNAKSLYIESPEDDSEQVKLSWSPKTIRPNGALHIEGNTAIPYRLNKIALSAAKEWAQDNNVYLATRGYPDHDNVIKTIEDLEQDNIYSPEWNNPEDHFLERPDPQEKDLKGPQKCHVCNQIFPSLQELILHKRTEENNDDIENHPGDLPHPNFDDSLPFKYHEMSETHWPYEASASAPIPFIFDIKHDNIAVGSPQTSVDAMGSKFQPGGIVRGVYENGKIIFQTMSDQSFSTRHLLDLWTYSPSTAHLPIKTVWLEDEEGKPEQIG